MSVLTNRNIQGNVYDPDPLQADHFISQIFTHSPDLAVEALGEDDPEGKFSQLLDLTLFGYGIKDGDPVGHPLDKTVVDLPVHRHHVFLLVIVPRPEDLVDDIAIVSQKDESFTGFVESADREDPGGEIDIVNDVLLLFRIGSADDPDGLVE